MEHTTATLLTRLSLLALVAALFLASPAAAKTERATSGSVTASFSYVPQNGGPGARDLRISIRRDGRVLRDERITCSSAGLRFCPELAPGSNEENDSRSYAIIARNLDVDPEPEVLADLWTGGATCCGFSLLYDFRPERGTYTRTTKLWGGHSYALVDLDADRVTEFRTLDYRFDGVFAAKVVSSPPLQIWSYRADRFNDVTERFPALIARHARHLWESYRANRRHGEIKGVLASYLADEYLLAHRGLGWDRVRRAYRAGHLRETIGGRHYLRKLRRFLQLRGYDRRSRPGGASRRADRQTAAASARRCSRRTARSRIPRSGFGNTITTKLRRYAEAGAGPVLGYGIAQLICADVTRDGRAEMIVLLKCCTANTPTPWAIYERKAGAWRPVFQVVSRKISVTSLRVDSDGDLVEKLPRYASGDPLCCPSAFSYRATHWNGSRFVVRHQRQAPS
jgi:hypothetical protein